MGWKAVDPKGGKLALGRHRTLRYRDGEDFVFDDNRAHMSINSTPYPRLILVVDFPRHDMPVGERVINAAVMRVAAPSSSVVGGCVRIWCKTWYLLNHGGLTQA